MILESPAFADGGPIPQRFTCDGEDLPPPLAWRDVPAGTETFALVVDDPDAPAGTWAHWVLFDLPGTETGLAEGMTARTLPPGTLEGTNSWGRRGYGGPCPPSGTHRYVFALYALDGPLGLDSGATAAQVLDAVRSRSLAESRLVGRYGRR
jgi:Raf kinase inhibitor-like YbhB/YbcL family protein